MEGPPAAGSAGWDWGACTRWNGPPAMLVCSTHLLARALSLSPSSSLLWLFICSVFFVQDFFLDDLIPGWLDLRIAPEDLVNY